jgi:uncharacterized protein (DUF697 family)
VSVRGAIASRLIPDVHRFAPDVNRGFVHHTLARAIAGVGPLPPAAQAAEKQLEEQGGDVDRGIGEVIENHAGLAAAQGFVTNLGGLITMAATVPVNVSGLALLQSRMVAGIAHLRGYDLDDPRVRNAVLLTMLGPDAVKQLVKKQVIPGPPMVIATAPAYDASLDAVIAGEVTSALLTRVVGKRAAKTVARRIPVAGGFYGAGSDAYTTWQVGRYARKELKPRALRPSLRRG